MNKTKAIAVAVVILLGLVLAVYVGTKQPTEKQLPDKTEIPVQEVNVTPISMEPVNDTVTETPTVVPTSRAGIYGGIPGNASKPPAGTTIDANLTKYYGVPTTTGNGMTYWFIGGWGWFNETEMMGLPSESLMYDISPYAVNSGGGSGIFVPIEPWVLVLFAISVLSIVLVIRHKKK